MSVRRWPDGLPPPLGPGYRLGLADAARRTEMEVAVRARRITTSRRDRPVLSARLTDAEFEALRAWWGDEVVSLAGASDSLEHWAFTGASRAALAAAGPDAVACDALAETAGTGEHRAEVTLDAESWVEGDVCTAVLSLLGLARSGARAAIRGRDGVLRGATLDLATGELSAVDAGVTARSRPHRGWQRLQLTAPAGEGGETPRLRVGALDAGAAAYAGSDGAAALALGQVNLRRGASGVFVPCDATGAALGAAGGSAWFFCEIGTGGGLVRRELLPLAALRASPRPGLNWEFEIETEARDA